MLPSTRNVLSSLLRTQPQDRNRVVRDYQGRRHTVTVAPEGYVWEGKRARWLIHRLGSSDCDACLRTDHTIRGQAGQRRNERRRIDPGVYRRLDAPGLSLVRAAGVRSRPGNKQIALAATANGRFGHGGPSAPSSGRGRRAQQGIFLCPADLSVSFIDNLKAMTGWDSSANILKLCLDLKPDEAFKFARHLKSMNLGCEVLFPGLDGVGRSIGQQIVHYRDLAEGGAGTTG
jgi:hypothetical protein